MPTQSDWEFVSRDVAQAITYGGVDLGFTADSADGISLFWSTDEVEMRVGELGTTPLYPRHAGMTASATLILAGDTEGALKAMFNEWAEGRSVDLNINTVRTGARLELQSFEFVGISRRLTAEKCRARVANTGIRRALSEENVLPVRLTFYPGDDGSLCQWVPTNGVDGNEANGVGL